MDVLILDEPEWAEGFAARVREEHPGATAVFASSVEEARSIARERPIDVLVIEPAMPETPGGPVQGAHERVTLSHRVVASGFPGLRFAGDLRAARPRLRLFVHTHLPPDHSDVLALWELGAEMVVHKGARTVAFRGAGDLVAALAREARGGA